MDICPQDNPNLLACYPELCHQLICSEWSGRVGLRDSLYFFQAQEPVLFRLSSLCSGGFQRSSWSVTEPAAEILCLFFLYSQLEKMAMDFRQLDIHSVYNYAHFRTQCEGLWVRKEEREKPNQKRGSGSLQFFLSAWRSLCWGSGLPRELV